MRIVDLIPLWGLFLFTCAMVMLSLEGGFRLGTSCQGKSQAGNVGAIVQPTLGLIAFILAFTFSVAAERFNERRFLVIDEANSISTTFFRADFLPAETKDKVQNLFRQYVALRLQPVNDARVGDIVAESDKVQDLLWDETVAVGKANMDSDVVALFIDSMNETRDLQSKRVAAALYARLPDSIWVTLFVMIVIGMTAMGYQTGLAGSRNLIATSALMLSFAIVTTLIADLDRPGEGFMMASKKPMHDLAKKIGLVTKDYAKTLTR